MNRKKKKKEKSYKRGAFSFKPQCRVGPAQGNVCMKCRLTNHNTGLKIVMQPDQWRGGRTRDCVKTIEITQKDGKFNLRHVSSAFKTPIN